MTIDDYGEVQTPFLRSAFNYDMDAASQETALICELETRTQQQFLEETDINTMIDRFGLLGEFPSNLAVPLQSEFLDLVDYQSALNKLIEADEAFYQVPAKIRAEFQNDPGKFVDYVSDPNPDEAKLAKFREWGYAPPERPRQGPVEVKVIPDSSDGK